MVTVDQMPDITAIVAVRNRVTTVRECLDSILAQIECRVQIVVVDGASRDGTLEVLEHYGDRIELIRGVTGGVTAAWNSALGSVRGRWCAFIGADDALEGTRAFAELLGCARSHEQRHGGRPVLVAGAVRMVGVGPDKILTAEAPDLAGRLRSGRMIPHCGALHDIGAVRAEGGFDRDYAILADLELALRLADRGAIVACPALVATVRAGGISTSAGTQPRLDRERYAVLSRSHGWASTVRRAVYFSLRDRTERRLADLLPRVVGRRATGQLIRGVRRTVTAVRGRRHSRGEMRPWEPQ